MGAARDTAMLILVLMLPVAVSYVVIGVIAHVALSVF